MPERFSNPEKLARRDDEPDVEGHRFATPVENENLNPEADEPTGEDGEQKVAR
jgi:hypothetical protein